MPLDIPSIRQDFPILSTKIGGEPLAYLDSAATSQKPHAVLAAMTAFYEHDNAGVHRGVHAMAERATEAYENARRTVARFVGASHAENIVFTKSCTEAINLVARSWGGTHLEPGDAVIVTMLEHHSNIVPWLQLQEERGIELRWVDIEDDGTLKMDELDHALGDGKAKLVACTLQSNVLGVRPPTEEIIARTHAAGAFVLLDAAQAVAHQPIDITKLDCDFLTFSGHKIFGPTGIGVLAAKREHLLSMPAMLGGGGMIREVRTDGFLPADPPARFEAGSPSVAEAVGLAAAIDWLTQFDFADIAAHEHTLIAAALEAFQKIPGCRILGPGDADRTHGCISFTLEGIHPHDLTEILGRKGVCLRAGHHCTQPLHQRLGIPASTRLSVALYNTAEEIDCVPGAIEEARALLLHS